MKTDKQNSKQLSRRDFLRNTGASGAGLTAVALTAGLSGCSHKSEGNLSFKEIPHSLDHHHHVPENYSAQTLLSWGDPLMNQGAFKPSNYNASEQATRFGYNNDFIGFMPLSSEENLSGQQHFDSNNSHRGLLCINHEYTQPHLMFSGYASKAAAENETRIDHLHTEMQACGHSIVEITQQNNNWKVDQNSPYNRRITLSTPIDIVGPAAGSERLKTQSDKSGTHVLGTVGNCAGGKTPWGTVLIAEEGFGSVFMGDLNALKPSEIDNFTRLAIAKDDARPWGNADPRFNINHEPNEANKFGWMVELDPYDALATPKKLTALGRFEHEGTTIVAKDGQPVVAYSGDDDEFQFIYKFISDGTYNSNQPTENRQLLESGTLYAAKLNDDGSGEWLPLTFGEPFLTEQFGFNNQADVMIECRRAASMIGATPMDRPEDIETNPVNDCTYVMLTKNKKRKAQDPGNLRPRNTAGHILEFLPPGIDGNRDHSALQFKWNTFILGGHPNSGSLNDRGFYGTGPNGESVSEDGWFATPDNLTFDALGNMWVATDGCEAFHFHDGLWAMPTSGPYRAIPKHFFGCPLGAEVCGPEFTPDGTTLFVAVQHPGDTDDSLFDSPAHRWPDFDPALPPRPSVLAITKNGGGIVGS